jgi:hypothetical protein
MELARLRRSSPSNPPVVATTIGVEQPLGPPAPSMSADEMIACLGSCRARWEIAAMIQALSQDPWLNTPAETQRLEAARAAMANW